MKSYKKEKLKLMIALDNKLQEAGFDRTKVYYLASPYSHDSEFIKNFRYLAVDYAASILNKLGYHLIEPISMCHDKSKSYDLPSGYRYWKTRDRNFVKMSDGIIVFNLPGTIESIGVQDEIQFAQKHGKKEIFLQPEDLFLPEELLQFPRLFGLGSKIPLGV